MYLITGATGNIGSELLKIFARKGVPARALVRGEQQDKVPGIDYVVGNFDDDASLRAALKGIKRAFLVSPFSPSQVDQEKRFATVAEEAGAEVIVKVSSSWPSKRSKSLSNIHRGHGEIEEFIQETSLNYVFLRPNFFMQNLPRMFSQAKAIGLLALPAGDLRAGMVDTRDIAEVAAVCLSESKWWNHSYSITGRLTTFQEAAKEFSRVSKVPFGYQAITLAAFEEGLAKSGLPAGIVDVFTREWTASSLGGLSIESDMVSIITGKEPRSLTQYMDDHSSSFAV